MDDLVYLGVRKKRVVYCLFFLSKVSLVAQTQNRRDANSGRGLGLGANSAQHSQLNRPHRLQQSDQNQRNQRLVHLPSPHPLDIPSSDLPHLHPPLSLPAPSAFPN